MIVLWIIGIWTALSVVTVLILSWLLRTGKIRFVVAPTRLRVRHKRSSGSQRIP